MIWEYAEMSKAAEELGRPANLADVLEQAGREYERALWIPRMCVTLGIMLGVGMLISHIRSL